MTTISKEETGHIAYLSNIRVNDATLDKLAPQLRAVLSYAACVKEVQGAIAPGGTLLKENRTRKDEVNIIVPFESLLKEVPTREGSLILVPMILEHT